jgi:hypothetical protein
VLGTPLGHAALASGLAPTLGLTFPFNILLGSPLHVHITPLGHD